MENVFLGVVIVAALMLVALMAMYYPPLGLVDLVPFIRPRKRFAASLAPPAPDYARADSWFQRGEGEAEADVFFVHRTTLGAPGWNASTRDGWFLRGTFRNAVDVQTQVFRGVARIFAPKYRQAALYSFYDSSGDGALALELAYQDVRAAFQYYLNHHHAERPFILAGHSQGTHHLERLIRELVDPDPVLRARLVCAYLPAMPIPMQAFEHIPVGDTPSAVGCYVSWSTFGKGARPRYFPGQYENSICTNPLSWRTNDETWVPPSEHRGSVTYYRRRRHRRRVGSHVQQGVLHIDDPGLGYLRLWRRDYVVLDYHLFFENIRENARARIEHKLAGSRGVRTAPA